MTNTGLTPQPFEAIAAEGFDRVLTVNVRGTFEAVRAVAPRAQKATLFETVADRLVATVGMRREDVLADRRHNFVRSDR